MDPAAPGRRSHRKSRAGCLQCKRRKVKCDERKPVCRNCTVHGVDCSFEELSNQNQGHQPAGSEQSPGTTSPRAYIPDPNLGQLGPFPAEFAIFDLEILHHYMSSTCYTLSRVPAIQTVWREYAPRIGFSTPFVLHALLAVSALHLGRCEPLRRAACFTRAQWHHDIAIRSVVPAVPSLASENSAALFLFSSLTCIFSCACNRDEESFLTLFEGGQLCDWVRLFRGTKTIIDSSSEDFHTGKLAPMFLNGSYSSAVRRGPQAMDLGQMYVWELKRMIDKECSHNEQILRTYQETLNNVGRTLGVVLKLGEGRGLETADVFAWLLEVSDDYLDLLRTWDPVALIIFSYFCVALRQIEWMWWMEGLSGRLMKQITSVLDEKYCSWLRWPKEQIGWDTLGSS